MGYPAKTFNDPPSAKEMAVLKELTDGHSKVRIGRVLHLSPYTVGTHLSAMYKRYRVHTAAELVAVGFLRGWLTVPPQPRRGPVRACGSCGQELPGPGAGWR